MSSKKPRYHEYHFHRSPLQRFNSHVEATILSFLLQDDMSAKAPLTGLQIGAHLHGVSQQRLNNVQILQPGFFFFHVPIWEGHSPDIAARARLDMPFYLPLLRSRNVLDILNSCRLRVRKEDGSASMCLTSDFLHLSTSSDDAWAKHRQKYTSRLGTRSPSPFVAWLKAPANVRTTASVLLRPKKRRRILSLSQIGFCFETELPPTTFNAPMVKQLQQQSRQEQQKQSIFSMYWSRVWNFFFGIRGNDPSSSRWPQDAGSTVRFRFQSEDVTGTTSVTDRFGRMTMTVTEQMGVGSNIWMASGASCDIPSRLFIPSVHVDHRRHRNRGGRVDQTLAEFLLYLNFQMSAGLYYYAPPSYSSNSTPASSKFAVHAACNYGLNRWSFDRVPTQGISFGIEKGNTTMKFGINRVIFPVGLQNNVANNNARNVFSVGLEITG